jgi:hypothetical protein
MIFRLSKGAVISRMIQAMQKKTAELTPINAINKKGYK